MVDSSLKDDINNSNCSSSSIGTGIWIFGGGRPTYGSYSLEIDGQVLFNGSAKTSSDSAKQLLCSASGLAFGSHTAILRNTDGAPIDIDFIDFETRLGQSG